MKTAHRIAAITLSAAALTAGGATAAFAGSSDVPVPGDSATLYTTPTPRPTIPVPTPQRNPFRGCRFATTSELTFAPQLGRVIRVRVPSIVCISARNGVQVYTLSGPSLSPF